ncbi:MAG TPA: hypothetical protein VMT20_05280 [Terriglobia bacterium]|nr:hypothetical protein [Terriglobia bacterium]
MNVVVIGGHTRNIGKTSVMSALIREFSSFGWTAVKITQYGHGICSHDGQPCGCAPTEHPFALTEETDGEGRADTCRYLAAGARQSLWLRARQGQLASALPLLYRKLRGADWVIIESNSILEFIEPLLYLVVVDGSRQDFKSSAQRSLASANAFISVNTALSVGTVLQNHASGDRALVDASVWHDLGLLHDLSSKPIFSAQAPDYSSAALAAFVRGKLAEATRDRSFAATVASSSA